MALRLLLLITLASEAILASACSPYEWAYGGGAKTSAEYAQILLNKASALTVARVLSTQTIVHSQFDVSGYAQIEVRERFKGPDGLRIIYTKVKLGNCSSPSFTEGEERLFVLMELDGKFTEVYAWQHPRFPQTELIGQLRKLVQSNPALQNRTGQKAAGR